MAGTGFQLALAYTRAAGYDKDAESVFVYLIVRSSALFDSD